MLRSDAFLLEEYPLNTDAVGTAPPDAFGPFRVLHQIGAGALGPVFRAYQPEQDRLVAVKLFRLDLPPERVHQLVAELEKLIAADLTHPGIAAPIAAGISDVHAYLAQDFVAADSLDIVVRDSKPSNADVVRVTTQLASALDLAAAIQIRHGALHPRDVLMSGDDVRMTGLGITNALAQVGIVAPVRRPYTAPERAAGEPWDRRADVFSLATLVFELLTARRVAGSGEQAVESLTEVAGADNAALARALTRALDEQPSDRFATAGDFARALSAALDPSAKVAARAAVKRRRAEESIIETPVFAPVPTGELPLLSDEMFVRDDETSPAMDDAPPAILEHHELPLLTDAALPQLDSPHDAMLGRDLQTVPVARFAFDDPPHDWKIRTDAAFDRADVMSEEPPARSEEIPTPPGVLMEATPPVERQPSGVFPLMLALVVGIAIGFGIAMLTIGRDRPADVVTQVQAPSPPTVIAPDELKLPGEPVREFTERAVEPTKSPAPTFVAPSAAVPPTRSEPGPARGATAAKAPAAPVARVPAPTAKRSTAKAPQSVPARRPSRVPTPAAAPVPAPPTKTAPGTLVVDSRPTGARVFLDGRSIGTTPLVLNSVAVGDHAIRLDMAGYQGWGTSVKILSGERSRVAASLER